MTKRSSNSIIINGILFLVVFGFLVKIAVPLAVVISAIIALKFFK